MLPSSIISEKVEKITHSVKKIIGMNKDKPLL